MEMIFYWKKDHYKTSIKSSLKEISAFIDNNDFKKVYYTANRIKGLAGLLQIKPIKDTAEILEIYARKEHTEGCRIAVATLKNELHKNAL